ncbi:hypothetical protein D3C71_2099810 [compost metagenome]
MTTAPDEVATLAIAGSSVETNTWLIEGDAKAVSMEYCNKGLPASGRIFLPGRPLEPPRANINAKFFI